MLDGDKQKDLKFQCLKKHTVVIRGVYELLELVEKQHISSGDQVKIRLKLNKSDFVDWPRHKKEIQEACEELGLDLRGIEVKHRVREKLNVTEQKQFKHFKNLGYNVPIQEFKNIITNCKKLYGANNPFCIETFLQQYQK